MLLRASLQPCLHPAGLSLRHAGAVAKPVMNRAITHDPVRVSYVDGTGEKKNEIMSRKDALAFAKDVKLDLILSVLLLITYCRQCQSNVYTILCTVKADADPAVCRIADHKQLVQAKIDKAKVIKAKQKEIREIHIGVRHMISIHMIPDIDS